ncbi:MAG: hypothetical protein KBG40_09205 [Bacteroidales bacterium]|nr:hypothetical protein [Bacteroidales bacterium]
MKTTTNNTPPQGYKIKELGVMPEEWEVERDRTDKMKIFFRESINDAMIMNDSCKING